MERIINTSRSVSICVVPREESWYPDGTDYISYFMVIYGIWRKRIVSWRDVLCILYVKVLCGIWRERMVSWWDGLWIYMLRFYMVFGEKGLYPNGTNDYEFNLNGEIINLPYAYDFCLIRTDLKKNIKIFKMK